MTTFYEKRGRRYHPVAEESHWDSFPQGAHLVVCSPGSQLTTSNMGECRSTGSHCARRLNQCSPQHRNRRPSHDRYR